MSIIFETLHKFSLCFALKEMFFIIIHLKYVFNYDILPLWLSFYCITNTVIQLVLMSS